MATKRGNKEGTIYKKSNGKWRAQLSLGGRRLSFTASTHAEARDWLRTTSNQIDVGLTFKASKITFGEFLNEWLASVRQRRAVTTAYSYEQLTRTYIQPALGKIKLRELSPTIIQHFYNSRVSEGTGLRTVQKSHTVIHASLNAALKMGLIGRNPADATQPPKPVQKEMRFFTPNQARKFLEKTRQAGDRNYALYFVAMATGMREGELLGLRWENIDLENEVLNVTHTLIRLPGGGLKLTRPKTKTSVRSIRLGKQTVLVLKEQRVRLQGERKAAGVLWHDTGHVFPSTIGTPTDPSNLLRQFRHALKITNAPKLRFHDLRHTAAALMLNNGVDVLIASRLLGHAKPSITLDVYGHLIPSVQAEAAEILERLILA